MLWFCVFFFKQKTAYEMRISDWSSDVCSSDLSAKMLLASSNIQPRLSAASFHIPSFGLGSGTSDFNVAAMNPVSTSPERNLGWRNAVPSNQALVLTGQAAVKSSSSASISAASRSEEHKTELQSLMRISYAAFCMKT